MEAIENDEFPSELVVCGPAGTGKTYPILSILHCLARDEPGLRILFLRATRVSLTESVLVTFEQEVLPADDCDDLCQGVQRSHRHSYRYDNGSEIVVAGLDRNPSRILSTSWDVVYCNECIELTEEVWETLSSRLNRPGRERLGWLIGDTNPGAPTHWLKKRCDAGLAELWNTTHEANPTLWDGETWTEVGLQYLARLERLTGVRFLRLRRGIWAGVEGQIYDEWDEAIHVIDPFDIPSDWPRFRGIDFGYTNPFVCQWWTQDPDGRLYLYRELYGVGRIVADWAADIQRIEGWILESGAPSPTRERIEWTAADWDAEDRATLESRGIRTEPAAKAVQPGIEAVQLRLRVAGDGRPRLYVFRDCTVTHDVRLIEAKKPTCTVGELPGYVWAPPLPNRAPKEEPLKANDHGCDTMRYVVAQADGLGTYSAAAY